MPWPGPDRRAAAAPADHSGTSGASVERLRRVVLAQRDVACAPARADVVFRVLAASVLSVFPAEGAIASQPEGDFLVARACAGTAGPPVGHRIPLASTLGGRAVRTLQGQLCHDSQTDPRTRADISASTRTRSSVIVPLVHDGVAVGVIAAVSSRPGTFDETDLELLTLLADVASSRLVAALTHGAREALELRNTAVVEAMADGLVYQDLDGAIVLCNTAAERMLGLSADEMRGRTSLDPRWRTVHADGTDRPGADHPAMKALADGQPRRDEVLGVHTPDGRLRWLQVNAVPVRDAAGELTGVVASFADITDDREQDTARALRETRLRAAQELTGLAWWELDLVTGEHVWSDQMFRLVGLDPSPQPPTDPDFLAMIHPDDRAAALAIREHGFRTGHGDVYRVVHPDGTVRHLQAWTDVERDVSGAPLRVHGATIDVTDREELLASVAVSRASLAAALELTRTATWEWDVARDRLTGSSRMLDLVGRDLTSSVPGVDEVMAALHPDDRARVRAVCEQTVATGHPEEATFRVVRPDGSVRHVRAWADVRRAATGEVTHLWGTAMDVTEQAEAADRLRDSEEHFRIAFDNAPIGMSMLSLAPAQHGRYLRTNAAFEAMLGWTHEELRGRSMRDLTHPDDRDHDALQFERLAGGEAETLAFEKRYLHRTGDVVHAWVTTTVVHDSDGAPRFLVTHAMDLSDRLREQAELERLALTDTLTGLANRTLLNDRLDQALARLQRTGGAAALLLLDVDRFKNVNDSLGHQVGDALLVEVAGRIEAVSRADATVARLGGDEFVVLVEGLSEPAAVHGVADRLLEVLRRPYDLGPAAPAMVATVSMGVSVAADAARVPGDLYREADLALYRAKDGGRDQYALFDDELRARADRRLAAETLLRKAIAENTLVPVFQPIVDLEDGRVHAAEALVRIQDGDRLVLPAEFIDVAEETGLIVEVDGRMVERVAAEAARLMRAEAPLRRLTTNVSARSLEDPRFVERLGKALTWYGVPGSMLRVELTERSLLTTSPAVSESLARIRDLGVHVGLDDFGTGYSALAYLQRFDLQFLKIDRSFVARLGNPRDDAVVAAVVDLAHAHDLVVVGEGVETAEQLAALRRMGCDRAQGYYMGQPMPAVELDALISTDPRW